MSSVLFLADDLGRLLCKAVAGRRINRYEVDDADGENDMDIRSKRTSTNRNANSVRDFKEADTGERQRVGLNSGLMSALA